MFLTERVRLLREDPWTAQGLAEEIYAMIADDSPVEVGDGVIAKFNSKSQQVPFQIINAPATDIPLISVSRAGGGSFRLTITNGALTLSQNDGQGNPVIAPPAVTGGGSGGSARVSVAMPGRVVSGTLNDYVVTVYPNGHLQAGTNVQVAQLQNDSGQTIAAGTWVTVILELDNTYAMQADVGNKPMPGKIKSGTGDTYSVDVYPNGLTKPSVTVTVKQLQIDNAETIPVDTWTMVTKVGNDYLMQVPVWG